MKTILTFSFIFVFAICFSDNQKSWANSIEQNHFEMNVFSPEGEDICSGLKLPPIFFRNDESKINEPNQQVLNQVGIEMRNNPSCRVVVTGHGSGNKEAQQKSWDRVFEVINYLVKNQQIDRERFIFQSGEAGDENLVDLRVADENEEGSSNQPAPHPNLRR